MNVSSLFHPIKLFLVFALWPNYAFSWGEMGHRVVAQCAMPLLSPIAKTEMQRLLGAGDDLISIATWADEIRSGRPETRPWHYITMQVRGPQILPKQADTPNVLTALTTAQNNLLLPAGKDDQNKAEALRWMVHLLADAHQPLHAGEDHDKGGNETWIRLGRRKVNWHSAWDAGILEKKLWKEKTLETKLTEKIAFLQSHHSDSIQAIGETSFDEMIQESHAYAIAAYAHRGMPIRGRGRVWQYSEVDVAWADSICQMRLMQASIRLAFTLNRAFAQKPPAGFHASPFVKRTPKSSPQAKSPFIKTQQTQGQFVWSASSKVYHHRNCRDVERIAPKNLRSAKAAPSGMKLHQGCPK